MELLKNARVDLVFIKWRGTRLGVNFLLTYKF